MFYYFGYGSNMDLTSLRAKGVVPLSSQRCALPGWKLVFNVHHWFRHEGGVGNIVPSQEAGARVLGVLHQCEDGHMALLDAAEAYGYGYTRVDVPVVVDAEESAPDGSKTISAVAYVGIPSYLDDSCLPTQRYLNILLSGATNAKLDSAYIEELRLHPIHRNAPYPPFVHPLADPPTFTAESLSRHPLYTAVGGAVFDMSNARWEHEYLKGFFGGRDTTLFHLKRLDSSDGTETVDDVKHDRLNANQRRYLNEYQNEYASEYEYVGRFLYE